MYCFTHINCPINHQQVLSDVWPTTTDLHVCSLPGAPNSDTSNQGLHLLHMSPQRSDCENLLSLWSSSSVSYVVPHVSMGFFFLYFQLSYQYFVKYELGRKERKPYQTWPHSETMYFVISAHSTATHQYIYPYWISVAAHFISLLPSENTHDCPFKSLIST